MNDNPYASPLCYGKQRRWLTLGRCVWLAVRSSAFIHVACIGGQLLIIYKGGVTVFGVAMVVMGLLFLYMRPWSFADDFLEPKDSTP